MGRSKFSRLIVDVIMVTADQAGIGGIEAGYELAPDTVVVSGLVDFPKSMLLVVREVVEGKFEPISQVLGIKEDIVYLSSYHNFEQKLGLIQEKQCKECGG